MEVNSIKKTKNNIPKNARNLNTVMAAVLILLGAYHYTQPNAAWRSGTIESITSVLLLAAAYAVSPKAAMAINAVLAAVMLALGIRHLAIGGGWLSGSVELVFTGLLIIGASLIFKKTTIRAKKST
jgi:hypothetical protein